MTITRLSPQEAQQKLDEGYTFLDVRTPEEFEEGHPAGAYNVPLLLSAGGGMAPNVEFLRVVTGNFPKDARIVVGCRGGARSLRAATELVTCGYTDVLDQRAGWDGARDPFGQLSEPGWSRAGLPVEKGAPSGRSYRDLLAKS